MATEPKDRTRDDDPAKGALQPRPDFLEKPDESAGRDLRGPVGTVAPDPESASVPVDRDPRDNTFPGDAPA